MATVNAYRLVTCKGEGDKCVSSRGKNGYGQKNRTDDLAKREQCCQL